MTRRNPVRFGNPAAGMPIELADPEPGAVLARRAR